VRQWIVHHRANWLNGPIAGICSVGRGGAVYIGVHYPLDALVGALIGVATAAAGVALNVAF
jgi:membrane-associated phospholipid phosphatase